MTLLPPAAPDRVPAQSQAPQPPVPQALQLHRSSEDDNAPFSKEIDMPTHALIRGRNLCLVTVLASALVVAPTSRQVQAATAAPVIADHPTIRGYLVPSNGVSSVHNARVAEYLLARPWSQRNARVAEYLLPRAPGPAR